MVGDLRAARVAGGLGRSSVFLEQRVIDDPRVELDLLLVLGGARYGLALRYPRSKVDVEIDGGAAVVLTNVAGLWQPAPRATPAS